MNKSKKRIIIITLIGIVSLTLIGIYVNHQKNVEERNLLEENLTSAIAQFQAGELVVVDIESITPFTWDRLFVFGLYTPTQTIENRLGRHWEFAHHTVIPYNDGYTLLVFVQNGAVVQYLEFPIVFGDFWYVANEQGYSVDEAQFIVGERWDMIWVGENP